jgi:hypothetical protein
MNTPKLKKAPKSLTSAQTEALNGMSTVSEQIRYLAKQGLPTGDIARTLSAYRKQYVRYQWVRNVLENDRQKAQYSK